MKLQDITESRMTQILKYNKSNKGKLEKEMEELVQAARQAEEDGNEGEMEELNYQMDEVGRKLDKLAGY